MLGQFIDFRTAQKRTAGNKHRIYAVMSNGKNAGFDRITSSTFPEIQHTPKFTLDKAGKFFTIGSCFARNVENRLLAFGVDLLTLRGNISRELYEAGGVGSNNGALNAYTPHSMLDLIRLIDRPDRMTAGALQVGDDQWYDMLMSGLRPLSTEELRQVRETLISTYEALAQADTVIVTLGYTESWYDTQDKLFVNRSPGGNITLARHGDRYSFFNATAPDTIDALDQMLHLIRKHTGNRAKVIISTSPVPLHGTFTHRDVVSANQYSKSTLHSTAVLIADRYEWVDYFPSYEMVMNADRSSAWLKDGVHVNPAVVARIMDQFAECYFATPS